MSEDPDITLLRQLDRYGQTYEGFLALVVGQDFKTIFDRLLAKQYIARDPNNPSSIYITPKGITYLFHR